MDCFRLSVAAAADRLLDLGTISAMETLRLYIAGDFFPSARLAAAGGERLFGAIDDELRAADLRLVNVELPFGPGETPIVKSGPALSAPPETARLLEGRFDVALLANNHTLDHGPAPLRATLELLHGLGLRTVGAGDNRAAAEAPLRLQLKGFSLAIVNVCENEFASATEATSGAAGIRPFELLCRVRALAREHDIVLVATHGGNEMNPLPSPRVLWMNRALVEAGATAVVNSHPHVPQGIETWARSPIAYSLGNFVFDYRPGANPPGSPLWWQALPVRLEFSRAATGGIRATATPLPVRFDPEAGRLRALAGEEAARFRAWFDVICGVLAEPERVARYFAAWATVYGRGYFHHLAGHERVGGREPGDHAAVAPFTNLWRCEAHNELITTYVDLAFRDQLEEAARLLPELQRWMQGEGH